ncbi:hypothetical protein AMJ87_04540 [candidate division WOR_3 bacterium SM23_60]|uniref:Uncharacterized protein n=1 Tax=candidate division WOR_3 bacterium SM23_60 TaxID=1703780 RepID=A0A0S8GL00_UNCW3|nr:MAG: hypothetical protein AMJ87_04540 [candidate division WOR_3 bacterium SM23_60]
MPTLRACNILAFLTCFFFFRCFFFSILGRRFGFSCRCFVFTEEFVEFRFCFLRQCLSEHVFFYLNLWFGCGDFLNSWFGLVRFSCGWCFFQNLLTGRFIMSFLSGRFQYCFERLFCRNLCLWCSFNFCNRNLWRSFDGLYRNLRYFFDSFLNTLYLDNVLKSLFALSYAVQLRFQCIQFLAVLFIELLV